MCIRTSGLAPGLVVSDDRCDALERPSSRIQPCIVRPCTVKIWRTGRFGEVNQRGKEWEVLHTYTRAAFFFCSCSARLCADSVTELEALSAWKWTRAASPNRI